MLRADSREFDALDANRLPDDLDRHAVLQASAGTGKTYAIARIAVRLAADGFVAPDHDALAPAEREALDFEKRPARLLALTFTEKAAGELAARIRAALESEADRAAKENRPRQAERLALVVRRFAECVEVSTIHAFCQRTLVRHPAETGAAFAAPIADAGALRREALHDTLIDPALRRDYGQWLAPFLAAAGWPGEASGKKGWLDSEPFKGWLAVAERLGRADSLFAANLRGGAVDEPDPDPAPLGERLARGEAAVEETTRRVLAWREAAGGGEWLEQMKERCRETGFYHHLSNAVFKYLIQAWLDTVDVARPALPAAGEWSLKLLKWLGEATQSKRDSKTGVRDLVENRFAAWGDPEDYARNNTAIRFFDEWNDIAGLFAPLADLRDPLRDFYNDIVRRVQARYEHLAAKRGVLTYDHMVSRLADALERRAPGGRKPAASALRLADELRRRYRFAFVDEFQDTDERQWAVFRAVFLDGIESSGPAAPGASGASGALAPPSRLVVVGDPKQAIYAFRNADVRVYARAVAEMSARADTRRWSLDDNHRSAPPLVEGLNELFSTRFRSAPAADAADADVPDSPGPPWFKPPPDGPGFWPVNPGSTTRRMRLVGDPEEKRRGAITLVTLPGPDADGKFPNATTLRYAAVRFAAREICRLISAGVLLENAHRPGVDNTPRPLTADDCCVLVRQRGDYPAVDRVFAEHGLPIAHYKRDQLPDSDAAAALMALVAALARPRDSGLRVSAFLTPYFALPPVEAARLARDLSSADAPPGRDDGHDPAAVRRLAMAARRWTGWLDLAEEGRWTRLTGEWRRALLDEPAVDDAFVHQSSPLLENLEAFAVRARPSPVELRDYLRRYRAGGAGDDPADRFLRRDTDRPRVQVMTMHAAKGLEFPVVFVLGGFGEDRSGRDAWCAAHEDPRSPARRFAVPKEPGLLEQSRAEAEDDERCLFYVALTRARHRVYFPVLSEAAKGTSALHRLLSPAGRAFADARAKASDAGASANAAINNAIGGALDGDNNDAENGGAVGVGVEAGLGATAGNQVFHEVPVDSNFAADGLGAVAQDDGGAASVLPAASALSPDDLARLDYPDWTGGFRRPLPIRTSFSGISQRLALRRRASPRAASVDGTWTDDVVTTPEAEADTEAVPPTDEASDLRDDPMDWREALPDDFPDPEPEPEAEPGPVATLPAGQADNGDGDGDGASASTATPTPTGSAPSKPSPSWTAMPGGRAFGRALHYCMERADFARWARAFDRVDDPDDLQAWRRFWDNETSTGHAAKPRKAGDGEKSKVNKNDPESPPAPDAAVDEIAKIIDDALAGEKLVTAATSSAEGLRRRCALARMIRHAFNVPLPLGEAGPLRLRQLAPGDYRPEIPFNLACAPGLAWPPPAMDGAFADGAAAHPRGWITGSLDLLLRVAGRYWIVDWKTNKLDRAGSDPSAYARDALAREVADHYALQAEVYTLAARRWLEQCGAGAAALGGVVFLFTRGVGSPGGGALVLPSSTLPAPERAIVRGLSEAYA